MFLWYKVYIYHRDTDWSMGPLTHSLKIYYMDTDWSISPWHIVYPYWGTLNGPFRMTLSLHLLHGYWLAHVPMTHSLSLFKGLFLVNFPWHTVYLYYMGTNWSIFSCHTFHPYYSENFLALFPVLISGNVNGFPFTLIFKKTWWLSWESTTTFLWMVSRTSYCLDLLMVDKIV